MATILHIETATTMCSVAIGVNGIVKACFEINDGYSHAEVIESLIQKSLEEAKISLKDLDAINVSKGPGSYTGLRIGVSLAKGLCYGLNIPLISTPTLLSMSQAGPVAEYDVKIPMIDARRMEVYTTVLSKENEEITPTQALVLDEESYSKLDDDLSVVYFGPGSEKAKSILESRSNFSFVDEVTPSAKYMVEIGENKFLKEEFEDVAYFEPFYLKNFVAGKPKKLL